MNRFASDWFPVQERFLERHQKTSRFDRNFKLSIAISELAIHRTQKNRRLACASQAIHKKHSNFKKT